MNRRFVPALFVAMFCLASWNGYALADDGGEQFIRKMGGEAVATVNAKAIGDSERERRFGQIFRKAFDVPLIGRFVLGRYWRQADKQQRKEYLKLFEEYIVQTYTSRFRGYKGVSFKVGDSRAVNAQEQLIPSDVVRPGAAAPVAVQWRVRRDDGGHYRIVDVIAEGVSMLISQRDEFGSIIGRNDGKVAALIAELRARTQRP